MTQLLYLADQNQLTGDARVVRLIEIDTGGVAAGCSVVLDQTVFYPQGGGQASDIGTIASHDAIFQVTGVKKIDGYTIHIGKFIKGMFGVGDNVTMSVNQEFRQLNSRLQSAGHLIDATLFALGITNLTASKGYHFADGPYNEYEGTVENTHELLKALKIKIAEMIDAKIPFHITVVSETEAEKILKNMPVYLTDAGPIRLVSINGYPPIPCSGTHVANTGVIGAVVIRKITSKKGVVRIAYSVQ